MAHASWWPTSPKRMPRPTASTTKATGTSTSSISSASISISTPLLTTSASAASSSSSSSPSRSSKSAKPAKSSTIISSSKQHRPKHARSTHKPDPLAAVTVTVKPVVSSSASSVSSASSALSAACRVEISMSKGSSDRRSAAPDPLPVKSVPPANTKTDSSRPTTPSSPVQIPRQQNRSSAHALEQQQQRHHRHSQHRKRTTKASHHQPDSLSPSVAALLAVTDIPRRHGSLRQKHAKADRRLTVGDIIQGQHVSEKELSWSLNGSPLDVLLSPPEEDALPDDCSTCDDIQSGSALMSSLSIDSVPSLGDSFATETASSFDSAKGLSSPMHRLGRPRRRSSPVRKSLEPVRSPPDAIDDHPLSEVADSEDYFPEMPSPTEDDDSSSSVFREQFKPLRAAFKSNLTASLRAIRHAARSFSTLTFPSIPPDDFLSRSILTIEPGVPYADERRPPVSEEMPSAELRRYLNPTTRASVQQAETLARPKLHGPASIQMQTYKIHRSVPLSNTRNHPSTSPQVLPNAAEGAGDVGPPGMRQREMRENPDFIRIAVMEMAMRKHGKLDGRKPGRAQWALPPRKAAAREYEIGPNGVPTRWIPTVSTP